jgi:hypothetical protein
VRSCEDDLSQRWFSVHSVTAFPELPAEVPMNRYSVFFALLVAASFAVHSPHAGESASSSGDEKKALAARRAQTQASEPVSFIQEFLAKAQPAPGEPAGTPQVLFVTVAHPTETHLAEAFDHNVEALQDGLQAAGYLFDSSWIPWTMHEPRDQFDDEKKEEEARRVEDSLPGVLLFRNKSRERNPYGDGLIVFLVTEKPTGGIALAQMEAASAILAKTKITVGKQLRILGPSFSGSLASLVPAVNGLLQAAPEVEQVFLRSGSLTGGHAAMCAVKRIASAWPRVAVDFGSTSHDYEERIAFIQDSLRRLGISQEHTAILTEGESLYGDMYEIVQSFAAEEKEGTELPPPCAVADRENDSKRHADIVHMWRVPFPRDISSVRAGYESQGLFDNYSPAEPWKRFLTLKQTEEGPGDSIRTFGGPETMAAKESVLFGISEFLKKHEIQAAIILATNEQDRYFLSQFLHVNNSGVRVVVLDPTRLFLRGATAQFRGDMFVGEFPMLPLLHDWTGKEDDRAGHVFPDDVSQGIYFAAIDLLADRTRKLRWFREYSAPNFAQDFNLPQRPPLYLVALGSSATWPVAELAKPPVTSDPSQPGSVEMPFTLFSHCPQANAGCTQPSEPAYTTSLLISRFWKTLFAAVILATAVYCFGFWYANPILSGVFASFEPSESWRFWLFKVTIPAAIAGTAFHILSWSVEIPSAAGWWRWCEVLTIVAPLAIALSAAGKALGPSQLPWHPRILLPLAAVVVALALALNVQFFLARPYSGRSTGAILNTFREMHWESGLSLLPTGMLLLLAVLFWACESANGAILLRGAPPLPKFENNVRISTQRGMEMAAIGQPAPLTWRMRWIWLAWVVAAAAVYAMHFVSHPFLEITTLESHRITQLVLAASATVSVLLLFELMQFIRLWFELRDLLRALDRVEFRRSFVPIQDFNWRSLWSFTGTSFESRRAINKAQIDCLSDLVLRHGFAKLQTAATALEDLRREYNTSDLNAISRAKFRADMRFFFSKLQEAGNEAARVLEDPSTAPQSAGAPLEYLPWQVIQCNCKEEDRFSNEAEELKKAPGWRQGAERMVCLMYIGFIHTIIGRLHTLLVSIAFMFSLIALAVAIYPFAPFAPLLASGFGLLALVAWAFFKVFKEMNEDKVLARIVSGEDGKAKGGAYSKFAEAIALPLLTLASSLLPGGAGRLLELVQTLFNHGQ